MQWHCTLRQTLTLLQSTEIWFFRGICFFTGIWFLHSCLGWVNIGLCPRFPARICWNTPVPLLGEHSTMPVHQLSSPPGGVWAGSRRCFGSLPMGFSRAQVPLPGGSIWRQQHLGRARSSSHGSGKNPVPREGPPGHKQGQLCSVCFLFLGAVQGSPAAHPSLSIISLNSVYI